MAFFSGFMVFKLLNAALTYFLVTLVLSSIQLSGSQVQDIWSDNTTCSFVENETLCDKLPATCLTCDFFGDDGLPDCVYGVNTTFSCWPLDGVECQVDAYTIVLQ